MVLRFIRKNLSNAVIYLVLTVTSAIWLFPIFWLVLNSLRLEKGAFTSYFFPKGYTFDNYIHLFTDTRLFNFPRWFMNTLGVALFTCVIATFFVLMISYALSRLRFKSRVPLMNLALVLGMFPGFMSMIAVYHILKAMGFEQSLVSLVLVYAGGAGLSYYIAKGFFDTIPKSLDEAAAIDGASKGQIFLQIILPISSPIVTYTALISFLGPWLDFIFVSIIMKDNYNNYSVAVGLFRMLERENVYDYFTQFCAAAVVVAIPITILFMKMQRFYVEGVTGGSVKG